MRKSKRKIDGETKRYIAKLRTVQIGLLLTVCILFAIFAWNSISRHNKNLKEVAVLEAQESMQETVHNIAIRIDNIRERISAEAEADILDMEKELQEADPQNLQEIVRYLEGFGEAQLERKVEMICTDTETGDAVQIAADTRQQKVCQDADVWKVCEEAAVCRRFSLNGMETALFAEQAVIDELAKEEIYKEIHSEVYVGNQYVWVNEILNMDGGDGYAVRRIHPNLKESEGELLSTSMQDVKGNYPYAKELEEIREYGYAFHSYYFKNYVDDEISEKYSYALYYEPFSWVIATGETLDGVYDYVDEISRHSINYSIMLLLLFGALLILTFSAIIKICSSQAHDFQLRLQEQSKVYENIYKTMSVGVMRLCVENTQITLVETNPAALKLLGFKDEDACRKNLKGQAAFDVDAENTEKLTKSCLQLKEQWDSNVVECEVCLRDGEKHRIRVRDTLIYFEGNAKYVQRLLQDITAEYQEQERRVQEAEELATFDPMTGLKNKKAIETIMRSYLQEAGDGQRTTAVGFVDIDNFKDYNTKYGHAQGDEVIKHVAAVLRECVPDAVGRYGGDEFAFCILDISARQLEEAMERVYEKLRDGWVNEKTGEKMPTPCSTGIVLAKKAAYSFEEMIVQSDAAMYEAKARGKNTYVILEI